MSRVVARCLLVACVLFCWLMFDGCCSLCIASGSLCIVCCVMFVVYCLLFAYCYYLLFVARCVLYVVVCWLWFDDFLSVV